MRTANPALNEKTFRQVEGIRGDTTAMTIQGTVIKTGLLLALLLLGAGWSWHRLSVAGIQAVYPWMIGGVIGGLVLAIVISFKKTLAPALAPVYALLEGLFLGGISALFEARYPGIVAQAVGLTFGTLISLLIAYATRLIRPSENFKLGIAAATGGIFLVYLVNMILRLFGASIPFIHSSGTFGILFSLFVVVIAALNLVLDFDFIEEAAERGAPRYMEWYAAFGLLVTLIWLYIEILRLLAKLRER